MISALDSYGFPEAEGRHVLAAVSGGKDSTALLLLLKAASDGGHFTLSAAHFNHGIRGRMSDGDEAFCRDLCARLRVPFYAGRADVPALARERGIGIETAAREARYAFLYETADRIRADLIALAHHADDQAETVLMHLLRGSGGRGAAGMRRLSGKLYRPLLEIPSRELEDYLIKNGEGWREDMSNRCPDNPRNALRLRVMPEIEKIYPGAAGALSRFANIAAREDELLASLTDAFLNENLIRLPGRQLLALREPPGEAILLRAFRRLADADHETALSLLDIASASSGKLQIRKDLIAERTGKGLWFLQLPPPELPEAPFSPEEGAALPGIGRITASPCEKIILRDDPFVLAADAAVLDGLTLRTRRPGDRMRPLGCGGSRLLSDVLTDKKIDRPARDCLPLLCRGSEVLWIAGVLPSAEICISDGTKKAVRLELQSDQLRKILQA